MRNRMLMLALLCAFAVPAAAQSSGWKKLDGQRAPEISGKEWLNTGKDAPTAKELRGKVVLLEFFATW